VLAETVLAETVLAGSGSGDIGLTDTVRAYQAGRRAAT
jgi:hypothetical protein